MSRPEQEIKNGPAAAALLSAGLGCFVVGLDTVLAQIFPAISSFFNWCPPAGPLSGKSGLAVIVWLVSWAFLSAVWNDKEVDFHVVWRAALTLVILANLLVFPPVFEAFGH
ncbi:MAG: hypothetical protein HY402_04405 [Elusimicrobia bacterium]|nr:hypothetical protein [Elusimicrobiota bacterium]